MVYLRKIPSQNHGYEFIRIYAWPWTVNIRYTGKTLIITNHLQLEPIRPFGQRDVNAKSFLHVVKHSLKRNIFYQENASKFVAYIMSACSGCPLPHLIASVDNKSNCLEVRRWCQGSLVSRLTTIAKYSQFISRVTEFAREIPHRLIAYDT